MALTIKGSLVYDDSEWHDTEPLWRCRKMGETQLELQAVGGPPCRRTFETTADRDAHYDALLKAKLAKK